MQRELSFMLHNTAQKKCPNGCWHHLFWSSHFDLGSIHQRRD